MYFDILRTAENQKYKFILDNYGANSRYMTTIYKFDIIKNKIIARSHSKIYIEYLNEVSEL